MRYDDGDDEGSGTLKAIATVEAEQWQWRSMKCNIVMVKIECDDGDGEGLGTMKAMVKNEVR